jgi:non-homologous end joining protein Ku
MAARAYWKGSLKLSLVTCPVMLYPATTSAAKTRFHMINKETGNRLKQQMVDGKTGEVVEDGQKGRGSDMPSFSSQSAIRCIVARPWIHAGWPRTGTQREGS